jgi:hypothetical protein
MAGKEQYEMLNPPSVSLLILLVLLGVWPIQGPKVKE